MLITSELLRRKNACSDQVLLFEEEYPCGLVLPYGKPVECCARLTEAAVRGLDAWWVWRLLPDEGPGSKRAYALWCAQQVPHPSIDPRVKRCLDAVTRRVQDPESVSDQELRLARSDAAAAYDSVTATVYDSVTAAVYDSAAAATAYADARQVIYDAQLACLGDLLSQTE